MIDFQVYHSLILPQQPWACQEKKEARQKKFSRISAFPLTTEPDITIMAIMTVMTKKKHCRKSRGWAGPVYASRLTKEQQKGAFCEGSKRHKKSGRVKAKWRSVDGLFLCERCWKTHRIEWLKKNGGAKYCKPKQKEVITEVARRKAIFASWKDKEIDKLRRTPEYRAWRLAVLERDGYACQHCGKIGNKLHAHHIKTFKMNPESRYDVDNGITLCKQCHEDLHVARYDAARILRFQA